MGAYNCEGAHTGDVELSLRKSPNKKLSLKKRAGSEIQLVFLVTGEYFC